MDAGRARQLGEFGDLRLDVLLGFEHEVGEFVDDDDDVLELVGKGLLLRLGFLVRGGESLGGGGRGFRGGRLVGRRVFVFLPVLFGVFQHRRGRGRLGFRAAVERRDVAHVRAVEQLEPALHLQDGPPQAGHHLLGLRDDRHHQVRQPGVVGKFHDLRVDQDQPQLLRRAAHQQSGQDRVQAYRLAHARRASHQQVGQAGQVGRHDVAADVLAERQREPRLGGRPRGAFEHLAQDHRRRLAVRDFDADDALAGNRRLDAHALGLERQRDVAGEAADALDLDARGGQQFVAGDHRPLLHVRDFRLDAELRQRVLDGVDRLLQLFGGGASAGGGGDGVQQFHRRELPYGFRLRFGGGRRGGGFRFAGETERFGFLRLAFLVGLALFFETAAERFLLLLFPALAFLRLLALAFGGFLGFAFLAEAFLLAGLAFAFALLRAFEAFLFLAGGAFGGLFLAALLGQLAFQADAFPFETQRFRFARFRFLAGQAAAFRARGLPFRPAVPEASPELRRADAADEEQAGQDGARAQQGGADAAHQVHQQRAAEQKSDEAAGHAADVVARQFRGGPEIARQVG